MRVKCACLSVFLFGILTFTVFSQELWPDRGPPWGASLKSLEKIFEPIIVKKYSDALWLGSFTETGNIPCLAELLFEKDGLYAMTLRSTNTFPTVEAALFEYRIFKQDMTEVFGTPYDEETPLIEEYKDYKYFISWDTVRDYIELYILKEDTGYTVFADYTSNAYLDRTFGE